MLCRMWWEKEIMAIKPGIVSHINVIRSASWFCLAVDSRRNGYWSLVWKARLKSQKIEWIWTYQGEHIHCKSMQRVHDHILCLIYTFLGVRKMGGHWQETTERFYTWWNSAQRVNWIPNQVYARLLSISHSANFLPSSFEKTDSTLAKEMTMHLLAGKASASLCEDNLMGWGDYKDDIRDGAMAGFDASRVGLVGRAEE